MGNINDVDMTKVVDVKFQPTKDGRKPIIFRAGKEFPDVDDAVRQEYLRIVQPLNLSALENAMLMTRLVVYGEIIDNASLAEWLRPNKCDDDMKRLFDLLLNMKSMEDIEGVRIGMKVKGMESIQSISFQDQKFAQKIIDAVIKCYFENYVPKYCEKPYKGRKLRDILAEESIRIGNIKEFAKARFQHRPIKNQRIYGLLLLYFDSLKVEENKANYYHIIELMKLCGLLDKGMANDDQAYRLVNKYWHDAQKYYLIFWNDNVPEEFRYGGVSVEFKHRKG